MPRNGDYAIWGRAWGIDWGIDWGNDSFWVSVDGGFEAQWGIPHERWRWGRVSHWDGSTSVPQTYTLGAGTHTLRIKTREHGSRLDLIEITDDLGQIYDD